MKKLFCLYIISLLTCAFASDFDDIQYKTHRNYEYLYGEPMVSDTDNYLNKDPDPSYTDKYLDSQYPHRTR